MKIDRKTLMRILREELSTHYSQDLKEETDASGMSKKMHDALEDASGTANMDTDMDTSGLQSDGVSLDEGLTRLIQLAGIRSAKDEG
tara:strand:+ start:95 stop:355 length:261 start_codon:yes stop_codon:yes gene_type:complete